MPYRLSFRIYRRSFKQPLQTHHGRWSIREGILLRLMDANGQVGFGEIAPLPWFGSETLAQALTFCQQLPDEITPETIFSIPTEANAHCPLPACRFGFESALKFITDRATGCNSKLKTQNISFGDASRFWNAEGYTKLKISYSGLLPAGEAALTAWESLWLRGYRTFKWKIGVAPLLQELMLFDRLAQTIEAKAAETGSAVSLRLDANGGLTVAEAEQWLQRCDRIQQSSIFRRTSEAGIEQSAALSSPGSFPGSFPGSLQVEFLEQPLPVDRFGAMLALARHYATPLALDESVATVAQLERCYQEGWQGIFAIKPAIAGSPARLRQFCRNNPIDLVFSSVFETAIGRQAVLDLALETLSLSEKPQALRAVGFGIHHWFCEDDDLDSYDPEQLWQSL